MAIFAGPELTTMTAFLGALPILVFCIKKGFLMPKDIWTFDGVSEWGESSWMSSQQVAQAKDKQMKPFLAWLPYIVIGALLVVTRVGFFHLKPILTSEPFIIHIDHILGFENISWDFKFLWNPGIFPFILIAIFTVFLHKMTKEEMKIAFDVLQDNYGMFGSKVTPVSYTHLTLPTIA